MVEGEGMETRRGEERWLRGRGRQKGRGKRGRGRGKEERMEETGGLTNCT